MAKLLMYSVDACILRSVEAVVHDDFLRMIVQSINVDTNCFCRVNSLREVGFVNCLSWVYHCICSWIKERRNSVDGPVMFLDHSDVRLCVSSVFMFVTFTSQSSLSCAVNLLKRVVFCCCPAGQVGN